MPSKLALPSCPPSVGDVARERLYSYAHIQAARRQSSHDAQTAADSTLFFRPRISDFARNHSVRRTPLYPEKVQPSLNAPRSPPPSPAESGAPTPRKSADQLRSFLSRTAAFARQREARLQQTKLEVAQEEVRECTFRPALEPMLVEPGKREDESPQHFHRRDDVESFEHRCKTAVDDFEIAMHSLREQLVSMTSCQNKCCEIRAAVDGSE